MKKEQITPTHMVWTMLTWQDGEVAFSRCFVDHQFWGGWKIDPINRLARRQGQSLQESVFAGAGECTDAR